MKQFIEELVILIAMFLITWWIMGQVGIALWYTSAMGTFHFVRSRLKGRCSG